MIDNMIRKSYALSTMHINYIVNRIFAIKLYGSNIFRMSLDPLSHLIHATSERTNYVSQPPRSTFKLQN